MTKVIGLRLHGYPSPRKNACLYLLITHRFFINLDCCPNSIGDSAKISFQSNPENTVFDVKRLIGRKMNDNDLQRDIKHWQVMRSVLK